MKIYLAHSSGYDYENELYQPLKQSSLNKHNIYYPHDGTNAGKMSKDVIRGSDLVLAEVSYPSTGQGIELGWADSSNIAILCVYRAGSDVSGAIKTVCSEFIEYSSLEELIDKLESRLQTPV
jgi:hypothetical protein